MLTLDNGVEREMTPEEIDEWESRMEQGAKPVVPEEVTNGQAKEALLNAGLYFKVDTAIAAIEDEGTKTRVKIAWEYRPTVRRDSPFVEFMREALGLSHEQVDNLFIDAATL